MKASILLVVLAGAIPAANAQPASGPGATATAGAGKTIILDTSGYWRIFYAYGPPVARGQDGTRELATLGGHTAMPLKEWASADFDDSTWARLPGQPLPGRRVFSTPAEMANAGITRYEESSAAIALTCLRAKFNVTDPAAVKGLRLNLRYRGGVVVYINDKALTRGCLAKDAGLDALADDYPEEAFIRKDGNLVAAAGAGGNPREYAQYEKNIVTTYPGDSVSGYAARVRTLPEVVIPPALLRVGPNVLAIEIHRAAYPESAVAKILAIKSMFLRDYVWNTCALVSASLTSDSPEGVRPNLVRPHGIQVWNSQTPGPDYDMDFGDPNESLRPVRIVAPQNGAGSGKVVVGSDQPIRNLKASVGELAGKAGKIPASAIQVRFAGPTSFDPVLTNGHFPGAALMLDGLAESAPEEIPLASKPAGIPGADAYVQPGQQAYVPGAVTAVWVTVAVPADAPAGDYSGTLTISADGLAKPIQVPVELKVGPWTCPKPEEFHTVVDLVQSPESVALQYKVPLYGEEHWKLVEKSLQRLGYVGNWTLYLPAICQTNQGNEQSMVRWVKQSDGTYTHDFTILEKYLDLAVKNMGKPRVLCLYVWDLGVGGIEDRFGRAKDATVPANDISVTAVDADGKLATIKVPGYGEQGKENWQRLAEGVVERLKKRGLEASLHLSMCSDIRPSKAVVDFWAGLLPKVPWVRQGHMTLTTGQMGSTGAPLGLQVSVVGHRFLKDPLNGVYSCLGWKSPDATAQFLRPLASQYPILTVRLLGEVNVTGGQRGFGRIGLDFWPLPGSGGAPKSIFVRYPQSRSAGGTLDMIVEAFIPPGKDGASGSARLEMMREGLQEAEARIFIESALEDPVLRAKVGDELAKTARTVLDERAKITLPYMEYQQAAGFVKVDPKGWIGGGIAEGEYFYFGQLSPMYYQYFLSSGWQERSLRLFEVAGQVAVAIR